MPKVQHLVAAEFPSQVFLSQGFTSLCASQQQSHCLTSHWSLLLIEISSTWAEQRHQGEMQVLPPPWTLQVKLKQSMDSGQEDFGMGLSLSSVLSVNLHCSQSDVLQPSVKLSAAVVSSFHYCVFLAQGVKGAKFLQLHSCRSSCGRDAANHASN